MDKTISLSDLQKIIDEVYESLKDANPGTVSVRFPEGRIKDFGISVALADGRGYDKGDVDVKFPLGSLVKVPIHCILLEQNGKVDLLKKVGADITNPNYEKEQKPKLPISAHGIRSVSAIEPAGDPESKWNLIENKMIDLIGEAPELNENVYKGQKKVVEESNVENSLAEAGYYLYDDARLSIELYLKAQAMSVSSRMLAKLGATIAADGYNASSKRNVYDGKLSADLVSYMADRGPHKMKKSWFLTTGLPAKSGFGGGILAILPGVFAVAIYSPGLNNSDVSVRGIQALAMISEKLGINVFNSAKLVVK